MKVRRIVGGLAVCAVFVLVALALYPIRSTDIKALLLLCIGFCCVALVYLVRKRAWKILLGASLLGPVLIVAFGPHRPTNQAHLRLSYVDGLKSYHNIIYVWGGETRRGVDCSGLVRVAWIDTQFQLGVQQLNPGLVREAFLNWWFDASARELGNGYGTRTRWIQEATSVRTIEASKLQPGDLAVVGNGAHIMAYLGDNQWIEADPGERRVIELNVHDKNLWLDSRPVVVRWAALDEPRH